MALLERVKEKRPLGWDNREQRAFELVEPMIQSVCWLDYSEFVYN
jgi:hypothetical protein